jgi:hypothetical protein
VQNGVRYAYFAQARRLAIEIGGTVTVYDTLFSSASLRDWTGKSVTSF